MSYKNGKYYFPSWAWILIYLITWVVIDQLLIPTKWNAGRLWLTRVALLTLTTILFTKNRYAFITLWNQTGSGFNLAIWRILFFGSFLFTSFFFSIEHIKIALFSMTEMPDSARVPLPFWGSLTYMIPVNMNLSLISFYTLLISCFFAFIGFKTRWSILLFTLSGFYLFGVSQLFGKVNHNHYFVWFPAILAFSGCGDVLSIDSWLRTKSKKSMLELHSNKNYGRAFAATWLLVSIIYFFPAFQKIWENGLDWMFTDNLSNIINQKLLELPEWKQILQVQKYPTLCKFLATLTVLFEFSFIFIILKPKHRWKALAAGALFHIGTWLTMDIFFQFMIISYLSFINWEKLFFKNTSLVYFNEQIKVSKSLNGIAIFLIVMNSYCGFLNIHSWPLSCFPTFSSMPGNTTEILEFIDLTKTKIQSVITHEQFHKIFPPERFRNLELKAIKLYKENKAEELKNLITSLTKKLSLKNSLQVYLVKITWQDGKTLRKREPTPILELDL